jgi:hypothetical protein
VPGRERALRLDDTPLKSDLASHMAMLHDVRSRQRDFDVVHFHTDILHFPMFEATAERTLTTLHGRLDMADLAGVFGRWDRYPLVSISDDQRKAVSRRELGGDRPPRAARSRCSRRLGRRTASISPSSGASRRRSGRTARSASRSARACRSRSPPRSTRSTRATSARSSRR